jgi:hypothetical protein
VTALVGATLVAGCSSDDDDAAESDESPTAATSEACTPAPTPAVTPTGAAAAFDLDGLAVPIESFEDDGYFVVRAQAEGSVPDLALQFMSVVEEAGYDVAGSDDEGFEAEVFFSSGQVAAGQVVLTESDCEGVVDVRISLLDDPAVLPDAGPSGALPSTTPSA